MVKLYRSDLKTVVSFKLWVSGVLDVKTEDISDMDSKIYLSFVISKIKEQNEGKCVDLLLSSNKLLRRLEKILDGE